MAGVERPPWAQMGNQKKWDGSGCVPRGLLQGGGSGEGEERARERDRGRERVTGREGERDREREGEREKKRVRLITQGAGGVGGVM